MQGLWSTHRRNKLNLNAPPSPGVSTPATPSADEPATPGPAGPSNSVEIPPVSKIEPELNVAPVLVNGKRKLRPSRVGEGSSSKRSKTAPSGSGGPASKEHAPPTVRLSDLGGVEPCIEKLLELVAMPLCHPEVYLHTGVQPPRGVLLHGPPGCGKTLLAHAMAGVRRLHISTLPTFLIPTSGAGGSVH
jgi:ribosome biogenesis ATPase